MQLAVTKVTDFTKHHPHLPRNWEIIKNWCITILCVCTHINACAWGDQECCIPWSRWVWETWPGCCKANSARALWALGSEPFSRASRFCLKKLNSYGQTKTNEQKTPSSSSENFLIFNLHLIFTVRQVSLLVTKPIILQHKSKFKWEKQKLLLPLLLL